jgi:hypothetical protein
MNDEAVELVHRLAVVDAAAEVGILDRPRGVDAQTARPQTRQISAASDRSSLSVSAMQNSMCA